MHSKLACLVLLLAGCSGGYRIQPGTAPSDYRWVDDRPLVQPEPPLQVTPSTPTPWAPRLHAGILDVMGWDKAIQWEAVRTIGPPGVTLFLHEDPLPAPCGARWTWVRFDGGLTQTDANWTGKDGGWPRRPWPIDSRNLTRGSDHAAGSVQLQELGAVSWR